MRDRGLWAVLALATVLSGCSAQTISDHLPSEVALPAGAPARPETPYVYPAVHDMPPDRPTSPMTEEEQVKLEQDLTRTRDHQEGRPAVKKPATTAKKTTKKPQEKPKDAKSDGAKANP